MTGGTVENWNPAPSRCVNYFANRWINQASTINYHQLSTIHHLVQDFSHQQDSSLTVWQNCFTSRHVNDSTIHGRVHGYVTVVLLSMNLRLLQPEITHNPTFQATQMFDPDAPCPLPEGQERHSVASCR